MNLNSRYFFVSFAPQGPHNQCVEIPAGALINAIGILLGGIIGLTLQKPISLQHAIVVPKRHRRLHLYPWA